MGLRHRGRPRRKSGWAGLAALIVAAIFAYSQHWQQGSARVEPAGPTRQAPVERPTPVERPNQVEPDDGGIADLFRSRKSDVIVRAGGVVLKVLPDDNETSDGSSRHQRFVVQFTSGHTVLVAHNIDVSPHVPLRAGDRVEFRGEYEWNDRGGVVHWTHRDARGRHEDGWIRHDGRKYD